MKQDFKVGIIVGSAVVVIVAVWLFMRGHSTPQPGYGQGSNPAVRSQDPTRPRPAYPTTGSQPYAAAPAMTGTTAPMVNPGIHQEPNTVSGQLPAGVAYTAAPIPGASWPQVQASSTPTAVPSTPARTHVVLDGETLSDISDHYYGSPNLWNKILRANRSTINDPDRIYPGMKLVIPD